MNKRKNKQSPKDKFYPLDLGIGLIFTVLMISLGLILAINLRFLYYADIKWFGLETLTGLTSDTIRANYDALINYCSPFYRGELKFPSLPASASGLSHFAEVKVIFNIFHILFVISLIAFIIIVILKTKRGHYRYLQVCSITAIVLPIITLLGCAINFDASFKLMHKILFRNDDWLFDPYTDPIINLLPEQFFLQCAIVIIVTVVLGSILLYVRYRHHRKIEADPTLAHKKVNYYY